MGAGNYTLGKSSTFLTAADCAVLSVNQIFNSDTKTYYGTVDAGINLIEANYNFATSSIQLNGKFNSNLLVKDILYYHDPETVSDINVGGNNDYNAIAWTSKPMANNEFKIDFPLSDFIDKDEGMNYELKVKLVHDNGRVTETSYSYKFTAVQAFQYLILVRSRN